jgi:hypothetical protein
MVKAVISVGAAAIIAALVTVAPALQVEAGTALRGTVAPDEAAIQVPVPHNLGKLACAQRAWPYYGQDCLIAVEGRAPTDTRAVRVVTTDRLK